MSFRADIRIRDLRNSQQDWQPLGRVWFSVVPPFDTLFTISIQFLKLMIQAENLINWVWILVQWFSELIHHWIPCLLGGWMSHIGAWVRKKGAHPFERTYGRMANTKTVKPTLLVICFRYILACFIQTLNMPHAVKFYEGCPLYFPSWKHILKPMYNIDVQRRVRR